MTRYSKILVPVVMWALTLPAVVGSAITADGAGLQLSADQPLRAGFLLVEGVYNTELMAPWDVFQHTRHHAVPHPGIEVFTVARQSTPIRTAEGLQIIPDYTFDNAPPIDILVVPSAEHSRDTDRGDRQLIEWVRRTGEQADVVISLCWGAFILAEAGLLRDHTVTTFPGDLAAFARAFPALDLRVNVSFVHDGRVLTSQGGARSYDVAMYFVDLVFGSPVARAIGSGLLIDWPWTGEQRPRYISDPLFRIHFTSPQPEESERP